MFILNVGILTLGIGVIFAFQGLWLILPFAGLEVIALTIGLYIVSLRCKDLEVITISGDLLTIEKGRSEPKDSWNFQRAWVSIELKESTLRGHPNQLFICSKGEEIEVASFLSDQEREELADSIMTVLRYPTTNTE